MNQTRTPLKPLLLSIAAVLLAGTLSCSKHATGPPANRPPEIRNPFPEKDTVEFAFSYAETRSQQFSISATDPDGDSLTATWTLDGKPAGQSKARAPFVSKWTFTPPKPGTYQVGVELKDSRGGSDRHAWQVLVREPQNTSPRLSSPWPEDTTLSLSPQAQEFSIRVDDLEDRARKRKTRLSWHFNGQNLSEESQVPPFTGKYTLTVQAPGELTALATDSDGLQSRHTWHIGVSNTPPVLELSVSPAALDPGQSATVSVQEQDPDNYPTTPDTLWLVLNQDTIATKTGQPPLSLEVTLNYNQLKQENTITAIATDGQAKVKKTGMITKKPNQAPIITKLEPRQATIEYTGEVTITGQAQDPDNYPAELKTWYSNEQGDTLAKGNTITIKGSQLSPGTHKIYYNATDGQLTARDSTLITRQKSQPPTITIKPGPAIQNPDSTAYIIQWQVQNEQGEPLTTTLKIYQDNTQTHQEQIPKQGSKNLTSLLQQEATYTIIIQAQDPDNTKKAQAQTITDMTEPRIQLNLPDKIPTQTTLQATIQEEHPKTAKATLQGGTPSQEYNHPTLTIHLSLGYNKEEVLTITAQDQAGNNAKQQYTIRTESIFKQEQVKPRTKEDQTITINLEDLLKTTPAKLQATNTPHLQTQIQGNTLTITPGQDYNTTQQPQETITITAYDQENHNQGTLLVTPTIIAQPDLTIILEPLLTPDKWPEWTQPPNPNQKITIAQLKQDNTLKALYKGTPETTPINAYDTTHLISPDLIKTVIENVTSQAKIQLEPGKNYRIIISSPQTNPTYYEHITPNITLTQNDTTITIQLADNQNLPLEHTSRVVYFNPSWDGKNVPLSGIEAKIARLVQPPDSIYISTLPAKGTGNPVPQEWIQEIARIYQQDLQQDFMKTKLYPQGILHNVPIIIGNNPPPPGTPGVILWEANDNLGGFAGAHVAYSRGPFDSEIYSIHIQYLTTASPRKVGLHEAFSLFRRNNSDILPSIFNSPGNETIYPQDAALMHFIFSRYPNLRWFDRNWK